MAQIMDSYAEVCKMCQCRCYDLGPLVDPGVVVSGARPKCVCYNDSIFQFDPDGLSMSAIRKTPSLGVIEPVSLAVGQVGYLVGGEFLQFQGDACYRRSCLQNVNSYDVVSRDLSSNDPFPGEARFHAVGFSLDHKGYMGLGIKCPSIGEKIEGDGLRVPGLELDDLDFVYDFYSFNPMESSHLQWKKLNSVPSNGRSLIAFDDESKGYVVLKKADGNKVLWQFDPTQDKMGEWKKMTDLPSGTFSDPTGVFTIGNRSYLYSEDGRSEANFWMYIPEID